ncbi:MAG: MFS transporter [Actinomycetota bacterium]|nr:MFS transporter [Actinomycetota bacterium]
MSGKRGSHRRTRPGPRVLVASTSGIFVESFDWSLYALMAPYLAGQMFPGSSPVAKLLGAYVVFAAGFLARPFGSFLMGRVTDVRGRRVGLTFSVSLMALGALVIAVAPTSAVIGFGAAALVVVARLVQGIAMGGEVATAATYVVESAPAEKRYRFGAFTYAGDALGTLGATVVLAVLLATLGIDAVEGGGWRIAFLIAAALGLVALWIRRGAPESSIFVASQSLEVKPSVRPMLREHLPRMFLVFALTIGSTMGVYFGSVYLPQFAAHTGQISAESATAEHTVALVVLLLAMLASGFLADRYGPLALIRTGFTAAATLTVPLMLGLAAGLLPYWVAAPMFTLCIGLQLGVTPLTGARLFPVPIRAVALGVPAALAIALFGGTFPFLAEWFIDLGHLQWVPTYAGVGLAVSAFGSWLVTEKLLYSVDHMGRQGGNSTAV